MPKTQIEDEPRVTGPLPPGSMIRWMNYERFHVIDEDMFWTLPGARDIFWSSAPPILYLRAEKDGRPGQMNANNMSGCTIVWVGYGTCFDCDQPIVDELHYLCPNCRNRPDNC